MRQNPPPSLVWFRQDLRLADNPALEAAVAGGGPVLAVYVLDDEDAGAWRIGAAGRWWLHHALLALDASLRARGAALLLRRGPALTVIPDLVNETGAATIHAGIMHEPWARVRDSALADRLGERLQLHRTATLFDPDTIRTGSGQPYGVYGAFARTCRTRFTVPEPTGAPDRILAAPPPRSDRLDDWSLLPTTPDWAGGMRRTWRAGEDVGQARLQAFAAGQAADYATTRNLPATPGTSLLSPHLHWGEVSPRQAWHAAAGGGGADQFRAELLWREFSAYLLWHNPDLPERPLRRAFDRLPHRDAPAELRAWQRGRTGFPIVDAGMRQLWDVGWMHNRVRMIAASFLVKQLLMDWRAGERWFWDTLVDADLASNAASWQWVAGCGIDSQPFFRVFNPVTQGETWDGAGEYVRRWVPELRALPDKALHAPWAAAPSVLKAAGVVLGKTYPHPLVDLAAARQRALKTYRSTVRAEAA